MSPQPQQRGRFSAADVDQPPKMGRFAAGDVDGAPSAPEKPGYLSQVGTGIWNTVKGLAEVGSAAGGVATEPWNAIEHLRTLKRLLVDPQVDQAIQAADKWKAGDRSEAVGHALAAVIPGAGPAAANIGEKLGAGDVTGAAADATVLGGAMALPHVAGPIARATAETAGKAGTFTGAAVKGAAPGVAKGAAMIGGGELLAKIPGMEWPARIGMQYPGTKQVVAGVKSGIAAGKVALAERAVAQAQAAAPAPVVGPTAPPFQPAGLLGTGDVILPPPPDPSFVRSVPAQAATVQPKALLGPGPTITPMPAGADPSFVRSVPAEYPPVEGQPPVAATAATAANQAILEDLAQQLNGTSFAKADPSSQQTIRTLAARFNQPVPQELAAPPVQTRTPYQAPGPVAPSKSLAQMLQEEMAAKRANAVPPPTTAPVPQAQAVAPVSVPPSTTPPMSLEEVNRDMAQQPAPVLEQPGRSGFTATGEVKSKALRVAEKIGAARAKNANQIAGELHDAGVSAEQAASMKFDDPRWQQIADELGHAKRPSQQTVEATLVELRRLERK